MKQGVLAILDTDKDYVKKLGQYFNESRFMTLRTYVFSEQEKFDLFLENEKVDLFLVLESLWKETYEREGGLVLGADLEWEPINAPWFFKFQSARELGQELMDYYAKKVVVYNDGKLGTRANIYGVFAVGNERIGSCFAWELAKYLGQKKRTLYVNLKPFSGMRSTLGEFWGKSFPEAIYFLRKGDGSGVVKVRSFIQEKGSVAYLPPAYSEEDILEITRGEWEEFLQIIAEKLDYEAVVLDLWEGADSYSFWEDKCDYVFTPVGDKFSKRRVDERAEWYECGGGIKNKWKIFSDEIFAKEMVDGREFSTEEFPMVSGFIKGLLEKYEVEDGEV